MLVTNRMMVFGGSSAHRSSLPVLGCGSVDLFDALPRREAHAVVVPTRIMVGSCPSSALPAQGIYDSHSTRLCC
jgi:hypothetical protein